MSAVPENRSAAGSISSASDSRIGRTPAGSRPSGTGSSGAAGVAVTGAGGGGAGANAGLGGDGHAAPAPASATSPMDTTSRATRRANPETARRTNTAASYAVGPPNRSPERNEELSTGEPERPCEDVEVDLDV